MATSPPRKPFTEMPRSHFFVLGYTRNTDRKPPAQAAIVVFAATRPMPSQSMADNVDPGLNPYQPNHRITPPRAPRARSWGGIGPPPSRLNFRPRRGPRMMQPTRAMTPPTVCTTVDPAKSRKTTPLELSTKSPNQPIVLPSQPPGPHTQ